MIKERLRYQKNSLSYGLCLLSLLLNVAVLGMLLGYPPQLTPTLTTGFDVLSHIMFLMIAFLTAEKQKVYSVLWSYVGFGLGGFSALRIFIYLIPYNKQGLMSTGIFVTSLVFLVVITLLLTAAGVVCLVKAKSLRELGAIEEGH